MAQAPQNHDPVSNISTRYPFTLLNSLITFSQLNSLGHVNLEGPFKCLKAGMHEFETAKEESMQLVSLVYSCLQYEIISPS